ncbi:MAG: methylglyoxal synthase [Bacteroidales bacterium]|jgi:methylglyoxal synthase|nr:methylglyoxal synthase [Bacteroidales bacterium]
MKNIVIIAHDPKKAEMVKFLQDHREWILGTKLIATGRTAEYVEENGIDVTHLSPGKSGGYIQITDMIKKGDVDIVFFFREHKENQAHHEDIKHLLETCNENNIPLATNMSSAELLILGAITKEAVERKRQKGI